MMRSMKLGFSFSLLVCAVATTAFAQDPAPADDAAPAAEPAAAPAPPPTETSAVVTVEDAPADGKFVLGARLGYGIAMGDAIEDDKLSDAVSGHIPIWLDLGYMVTPNIMVGLYGAYGFGILGSDLSDACDLTNVDCSVSMFRFGLQGQYHFSPAEKLDPWVGLGIGYEWLMATAPAGLEATQDVTVRGFEFVNLQGGADFKLAPNFGLGPFLSFSLGQYSNRKSEANGVSQSSDIEETAMHEWLTIGVRGAFTL